MKMATKTYRNFISRNEVLTTLHLLYLSHQPSSLSQNGPRTWLFSNLLLVTTYVGTSQQIVLLNQEEERSHGCPNHPPAAVPITATMGLRDGRRRHPERNSVAHGRKSIPIAQATLWRRLDEYIFKPARSNISDSVTRRHWPTMLSL